VDPDNTFVLEDHVKLVGGWDGNTGGIVVDPVSNVVILSGYQDDGMTTANSYHVVSVPDGASNTQGISGCKIKLGIANGGSEDDFGGALINYGGAIVLDNCTFDDNEADLSGGAIYNGPDATTTVLNCTFTGNSAFSGGAIANGTLFYSFSGGGGNGFVDIWGTSFILNSAAHGGAVVCCPSEDIGDLKNSVRIVSSTFDRNTASTAGGGVATQPTEDTRAPSVLILTSRFLDNNSAGGGGVYVGEGYVTETNYFPTTCQIVNSSFCENVATSLGGGVLIEATDEGATGDTIEAGIINCTFHLNEADAADGGGGLYVTDGGDVRVKNCIMWENTSDEDPNQIDGASDPPDVIVTYSDIEGGWTGFGNIGEHPVNHDPDFESYMNCDVPISSSSPVIGLADAASIPPDSLDIDGDSNTSEKLPDLELNARVVGDDPDMGARERQ